jgi:hypothetical protein
MSMEDQVNTETAAKAKTRDTVSKREYIVAGGAVADSPLDASGFSYTVLDSAKNRNGGKVTEHQLMLSDFGLTEEEVLALPEQIRGLACFGIGTLAGNATNTIRNGTIKSDGPQTEDDALIAWWNNLKEGNWTSPRGEVEAGVTLAAEAYFRALQGKGITAFADGTELSLEEVIVRYKAADKEKRKAIRSDNAYQVALKEIQLERAKKAAAAGTGESAVLL